MQVPVAVRHGYAQVVLSRAPQLDRRVHRLLDQHPELAPQLSELRHTIVRSKSVDEPVRVQVRAWIQRLRQHETPENRLLEDAFNVEYCAED